MPSAIQLDTKRLKTLAHLLNQQGVSVPRPEMVNAALDLAIATAKEGKTFIQTAEPNVYEKFFSEACVLDEKAKSSTQELWDCWARWAADSGVPVGKKIPFIRDKLARRAGVKIGSRSHGVTPIYGIRPKETQAQTKLAPEPPRDEPMPAKQLVSAFLEHVVRDKSKHSHDTKAVLVPTQDGYRTIYGQKALFTLYDVFLGHDPNELEKYGDLVEKALRAAGCEIHTVVDVKIDDQVKKANLWSYRIKE